MQGPQNNMDPTLTQASHAGDGTQSFPEFMAYRPAQSSTQDYSRTSYDSPNATQHDTMMNGGVHEHTTSTGYQTWNQTAEDSNNFHQYSPAALKTKSIPQVRHAVPEASLGQENARLRNEVEMLQHDASAGQRALDDMVANLLDVQAELETARDLLAKKEADYAALCARLGPAAHGSLHSGGTQQATQHIADPHQQQRIDELTAELRVKDEFLRAKDTEIVALETRWQARLDQREAHFHQQRSQLESTLTAERAAAHETQQRLDAQATAHAVERQQLATQLADAQTASQAAAASETQAEKVADLQRLVQFYKGNSERTTEQARQLREKNQRATEHLRDMEREVEDLKGLNLALKMQAGSA